MTQGAERRGGGVLALGTAQTLAWASSYYLPAILADPISRELGIPTTGVFAAFSAALLLSAALGPAVGRTTDRCGGRGVLCLSSAAFAAGLALLAMAHEPVLLTLAWLVPGAGMALGLYDSAFATLTVAVQVLQAAGLVCHQRGRVTILDRPGLESAACGCYGRVRLFTGNHAIVCGPSIPLGAS